VRSWAHTLPREPDFESISRAFSHGARAFEQTHFAACFSAFPLLLTLARPGWCSPQKPLAMEGQWRDRKPVFSSLGLVEGRVRHPADHSAFWICPGHQQAATGNRFGQHHLALRLRWINGRMCCSRKDVRLGKRAFRAQPSRASMDGVLCPCVRTAANRFSSGKMRVAWFLHSEPGAFEMPR
jgi:hypothetical protein